MTIAREQIFGPVLSIIPYEDEEDVVRIANDTPYGLSGFVTSGNLAGPPGCETDPIWKRARERRPGRLQGLLWRLQTVGQRQRMGRGRPGRIPRIKSSFRLRAREVGFTCGIVTSLQS
jgi:Aldehyde dehydrogenase family